jgi:uncharacterized membrane protein (GlpM family)
MILRLLARVRYSSPAVPRFVAKFPERKGRDVSRLRSEACFKSFVVLMTAALVGGGHVLVGSDATAGFAFLGLIGLAPIFARVISKSTSFTGPEIEHSRNAMVLAFWCSSTVCIALALLAPYTYGEDGCIPVDTVQYVLILATMIFVLVESIVTLFKSRHRKQSQK